jgi:D-3-phosphoglycerate dehydrogenase
MATKRARKVAVLGARFGELDIEKRLLRPLGVELVEGSGKEEAETLLLCRDAEVILCGGAPQIRATLIRQLPHLKAIVRYGIGLDTIDLTEATRRGVYVANVPDYCIEEVATHALALILSWSRKLPIAQRSALGGQWSVDVLRPLQSARDQILGLVGFGRIARSLARMARAIGFQLWAADPYVEKKGILKMGVRPVSFRRLIRSADFVSLHLPLSPATRYHLDAETLRLMKPTAYLINCARGGLIDEAALKQALQEGWIAGAALDVMEEEPWPPHSPLRGLDNLLVTPHAAWYTERAQRELRRKACAEVTRVLQGKIPENLVNREILK